MSNEASPQDLYDESHRGMVMLADIQFIQSRAVLNFDVVDEYADAMATSKFPAGKAIYDGSTYYVYDGHHRGEARRKRGDDSMLLEWQLGEKSEAEWLALAANLRHGLHRTQEDKERAVKLALERQPAFSDRAIADHCGVSHPYVAKIRDELHGSSESSSTRTRSDGRKFKAPVPKPSANGKHKSSGNVSTQPPVTVAQLPRVMSEVNSAADCLIRACNAKGAPAVARGLARWAVESSEVNEILSESVLGAITASELVERASQDRKFRKIVLTAAKEWSE